ncbi:hypothetical protein MVEN_00040100 [Mycena venus]|uniref:Uncharacterized protein n=1 Tax=Mycena venus TaxID=2733690 RepID=A0A8H7DGY0_9AGAR|nr:hypothetical protein MVEN_00040100 [Mycena venus]
MAPDYQKSKAALARAARRVTVITSSDPDSSESDNCHWDGTEGDKVPQFFEPFSNPAAFDGSDTEWTCEDGLLPSDNESSDSDHDLVGQDLLRSFALAGSNDDASIATAYKAITEYKSQKDWKSAEKTLNGPYTGNSARTQRRQDKKLCDKEEGDEIPRKRYKFLDSSSIWIVNPVLKHSWNSTADVTPRLGNLMGAVSSAKQTNNACTSATFVSFLLPTCSPLAALPLLQSNFSIPPPA